MQFDWLTIAAQLANFLVLIWLLKRVLYGPIIAAMAERERRIEERLADARHAREEAEAERQTLRDRQQELTDSHEALLAKARSEADALRRELDSALREEAAQKRAAWLDHLKEDRAEIILQIQKRAARHVRDVVDRILAEFADTDLSEQIAREFALRIAGLGSEDRVQIASAAAAAHEPVIVESALALSPAARARVTRAIHDHLSKQIDVDYRTAADVPFGIRMTLGHQLVEWSAGRYLDRIETLVGESLDTAASEAADAA